MDSLLSTYEDLERTRETLKRSSRKDLKIALENLSSGKSVELRAHFVSVTLVTYG